MLRNKRDYRSATKNPEIVKELQNKEKNENQMETCQVEPLKKKDLMRYFKKVQKELRREVSSDNQDKKSSIVSEDSKNIIKKVLKNQEKPSNYKTKCFKVFKSSLLGRAKEKTKNVESPKSKHDSSDIYNDDASCSSYKKSTSDSTHLNAKRFSKNYLKSSNHVAKVPVKKQCCQYCQLSPKLQKAYSIKDNGKWRDTIKVHKHETNKNQSKEDFQSARTKDIRISGKQKSQRKISKLPVDTYSSSTKISVDSMSSSKTGKKNTLKLRHKYTQSIKSTSNKKITKNQNIGNISSDQFLRNATLFPIKDDLNSSEILHCEELLKQENKYHPPDRSSCDEQLNVSNLKRQRKKKSQDFLRSSKSQNNLSSLELEKSPRYLRSRIDSPREFSVSKSTECDSRAQILQLKEDVCRREGKYRGRFWLDNGRTNILGNGGDVSYKNKAGRLCEKRGQEKLCKLVNTCRGREWLGCSCEGEEEEETVDCFEYCRCPENVDNYDRSERRLQCQGSCKTASLGRTKNSDTVTVKNTCSRGLQKSRYTERQKILEKNRGRESPGVSFRQRDVGFVCKKPESQTNRKIVMASPLRKKNNAGSGQTCPQTFHRAARLGKDKVFTEFDRECFNIARNPVYLNSNSNQVQKKLTRRGKALNDMNRCEKSCQTAEMLRLPRESSKRIINNYNPGKEFSFEVKASSTRVKSNLNIPGRNAARKAQRCNCKELFLNSTPSCQLDDCSCIKTSGKNEEYNSAITKKDFHSSTPYHSTLYNPEKTRVTKLSSNLQKTKHVNPQRPMNSSNFTSFSKRTNCRNCSYCCDDYEFDSEVNAEKLRDSEVSDRRKWPTDPTNVRVMKPRDSYGQTNLKKVLIYPPHGEPGPPLTLYKNASRVNCKVKGNPCKGFNYNVTYIQKFVSPAWHPEKDTDSFFLGIPEKCDCSSGYG